MITNLFSIFDPRTPSFISANWVSSLLFVFLFPITMWISLSRYRNIYFSIINYVFREFKPLAKNTKFILIIPLTLFSFIILNNVIGLLPYIFTASSHIVFSLSLALSSWLALISYGILNNTSNLLVHLIPHGTPVLLIPFMVIIETISNIIRPFTLAIRLRANIIAGHLLIVLLRSATPLTPVLLSPILFRAQVALSALETAVAFIQAYVFRVLTTLYVSEAVD